MPYQPWLASKFREDARADHGVDKLIVTPSSYAERRHESYARRGAISGPHQAFICEMAIALGLHTDCLKTTGVWAAALATMALQNGSGASMGRAANGRTW